MAMESWAAFSSIERYDMACLQAYGNDPERNDLMK